MKESDRRPFPEGKERARLANQRRREASRFSGSYPADTTRVNNDETTFAADRYPVSFTKGLPHDEFGQLTAPELYERLVKEINQQDASDFSGVAMGLDGKTRQPKTTRKAGDTDWRGWESPRTGHYYDLQGPDADAVGMPPAPGLGDEELIAEMGEVYALALLRDVPFSCIAEGSGRDPKTKITSNSVLKALASLSWFDRPINVELGSAQEHRRQLARRIDHGPEFKLDDASHIGFEIRNAFRGSSPGAKTGAYLSQFMLLGNKLTLEDGTKISLKDLIKQQAKAGSKPRLINNAAIAYGTQQIGQKVESFDSGKDFMLHWNAYLDVQNGADFGGDNNPTGPGRFITTPRHLATYVRYDALYQAYLNACLFMLGELGTPGRPNFATRFGLQQPVKHPYHDCEGPGFPDRSPDQPRQGFAAFGGPHVLSLVTEVATRCLKAVRRQKFNYHRRARPERLGALLTLVATPEGSDANKALGSVTRSQLTNMERQLEQSGLLDLVARHNDSRLADADAHLKPDGALHQPEWLNKKANRLLSMAFAEGSPMHPSYGAGHATVAGGCITMLKAFFHTVERNKQGHAVAVKWPHLPVMQPTETGEQLEQLAHDPTLTVAGELNKLAANISIGRNMAGVHFYTDYYESLRMGERVAVGMLMEQMKQYNEPVEMDFHSFDGDHVHLLKNDYDDADLRVFIADARGAKLTTSEWWNRDLVEEHAVSAPPETPVTETSIA